MSTFCHLHLAAVADHMHSEVVHMDSGDYMPVVDHIVVGKGNFAMVAAVGVVAAAAAVVVGSQLDNHLAGKSCRRSFRIVKI